MRRKTMLSLRAIYARATSRFSISSPRCTAQGRRKHTHSHQFKTNHDWARCSLFCFCYWPADCVRGSQAHCLCAQLEVSTYYWSCYQRLQLLVYQLGLFTAGGGGGSRPVDGDCQDQHTAAVRSGIRKGAQNAGHIIVNHFLPDRLEATAELAIVTWRCCEAD